MFNIMFFAGLLLFIQSDTPIDYSNFRKEPAFNQEIDFDHINYKKIDEIIFHLTNEVRAKHSLKPLEYDPLLAKTAIMHAKDMVEGNFFAHINESNPKKRTPNDRAKLCAIINPILAENLIQGFGLQYKSYETAYLRGKGNFSSTPDGALIKAHTYLSFGEAQINGWMNSKDHRKNILSKDALQLGCGAAYYIDPEFNYMPNFYVVQVFQLFEPTKRE